MANDSGEVVAGGHCDSAGNRLWQRWSRQSSNVSHGSDSGGDSATFLQLFAEASRHGHDPPEPSFSFEFGLGPGYPKQVPLSDVPDNFRANLPSEATSALLLAPNVYAPLAAGESIGDVIQQSGLVGLCASVQAYVAEHPNQMHGYSCF